MGHDDKKIMIIIDKKPYHVYERTMNGAQIKALGGIDSSKYDLVLIRPGREDEKIADGGIVELHDGMKFMGIRKELTPGGLA